MVNSIHRHLDITICKNGDDARSQGFDYAAAPAGEYKPIEVKKVVVVHDGTVGGNPTVDFILEDDTGQKFVFIVTGRLVKSIPC